MDQFNIQFDGLDLQFLSPTKPILDSLLLELSEFKDFLPINFQNNDVILDFRGHLGVFSVYLAKKYPNIKIITLEPDIRLFNILIKNINLNDIKNIQAYNLLINCDGSNEVLPKELLLDEFLDGPNEENRPVGAFTINDLFNVFSIPNIKLFKLNCQGYEYNIIYSIFIELLKKIEYLLVYCYDSPKLFRNDFLSNILIEDCKEVFQEKMMYKKMVGNNSLF